MDRLNIFMSGLTIEKHISSIIIGEIPLGPGGLEIFYIFNWSITSYSDIIWSLNSNSGYSRSIFILHILEE